MCHEVVNLLSCVRLFATPWTEVWQATLSSTISLSLLKLMSIESVMPSNHLVLCQPFSSCLQSFPASGSFLTSRCLFASGGQSVGALVSVSVLLMNIQDWFPLGLTCLILQSKGLSRVFSNTAVQSISSLHQVAKVLEFQLQPQSFQWIFRVHFL